MLSLATRGQLDILFRSDKQDFIGVPPPIFNFKLVTVQGIGVIWKKIAAFIHVDVNNNFLTIFIPGFSPAWREQ